MLLAFAVRESALLPLRDHRSNLVEVPALRLVEVPGAGRFLPIGHRYLAIGYPSHPGYRFHPLQWRRGGVLDILVIASILAVAVVVVIPNVVVVFMSVMSHFGMNAREMFVVVGRTLRKRGLVDVNAL